MLRRYGVDFKPVSSNSGVYSFDHFTVLPLECRIASPSDHQNHLQQPLPAIFKKSYYWPQENLKPLQMQKQSSSFITIIFPVLLWLLYTLN